MQDNADISHKINIRHRALSMLNKRPKLIIDAYSGEGVISRLLWQSVADKVICIDKDKSKLSKININNSQVIHGDNRQYIHLMNDADIIDCDSYGLVMPFIGLLPKNKIVVFTDGTPTKQKRVFNAEKRFWQDVNLLLRDYVIEKSISDNAYYGFGWTK